MAFYLCSACWKAQSRNTRWRQRKLTPRLHFRHQVWEYSVCNIGHAQESIYCLYFFANPLEFFWIHAPQRFFLEASLVRKFGKLNFTCSESCILPLHRINLIIHFSQIKCALCSHLRTSCKSLWLVYTPVYSSCRVLSPVLARWRRAITPFKELFSWKLPRVYADYFPQST